jgi:Diguanylate cyclase, GGDEF domain
MNEIDLKPLIEKAGAETRAHFDVVAECIEKKIQFVGEAVAQLGGRLDREVDGLRQEMNRGFSETQAMIEFS